MSDDARRVLNDCGCCEGAGVRTPAEIRNRPGLDAIAYRVGTHATFKESMLARLSNALRPLQTRADDDASIALIDAWATAADPLAFYQERIANESFLRTATERLSLRELARLIGYELAPGVAAGVDLALRLDEPPALPGAAPALTSVQPPVQPIRLEAGVKVQSIPGKDETPQLFETIEPIEARVEWNAIRPRLTEPQTPSAGMTEPLWLEGATLNLDVGHVLLIVAEADGSKEAALRRIAAVYPDVNAGRTKVELEPLFDSPQPVTPAETGVWAMRVVAAPFGHNAPMKPDYNPPGVFLNTFSEWQLDGEDTTQLTLNTRYEKILKASWIVIEQDQEVGELVIRRRTFATVTTVTHRSVAKYGMAGSVTSLGLSAHWWAGIDSLSVLRSMVVYAQSAGVPGRVAARGHASSGSGLQRAGG